MSLFCQYGPLSAFLKNAIPTALTASALIAAPLALAEPEEEQVLVTGELRATPVLELANSVSVISEEELTFREARHLEDALNLAPNVNYSTGASRGRFIQIRGIGERSEFLSPINPSVGILVDGIDFSGIGTGVTGLDAAQTEIFRGPQGTQFGANALAGMINVVGNQVADQNEGMLSLGLGNFNSRHLKVVGNLAASESFGARLAFLHNASDGYINNSFLNRDDTNNFDENSARLLLEFKPTENIDLSWVTYLVDVDNGYDTFSLDNTRTTLSDQPGEDSQETVASALNAKVSFDSIEWQTILSGQSSDMVYGYDEDWSFRDICPITSDCAFFQYSSTDYYDRDNDNVTVDTRLISNTDSAVQWVLGIYSRTQSALLDRTRTDNLPNGDPYDDTNIPVGERYSFDFDTDNLAFYGEASLDLGRTSFTVGARQETRDATLIVNGEQLDDRSEDLWGGKLSAEFSIDENQFVYALASRGYKAGGYNPELFGSELDILQDVRFYDTEFQWNYEIGYKGSAFNDRLTSQISVFYQDRDDVQVDNSLALSVDDFIGYIANAAETKSQGVELETRFAVSDNFMLTAAFGLLDSQFTRYESPTHVDAPEGSTFDLGGRDLAHAPSHQYFLAAHYNLTDSLYLRVEAEGKSSFYYSDSHNQQSPSYNLGNLRLGYDANDFSVALWVKNISDKDTANRGFFFSNDFGNDPRNFYAPATYEQFGAPRTFGVSGSYSF